MAVRFNLNSTKAEKSLILLVYRYKGRKLVHSTGITIPVKLWNHKGQCIRKSPNYPQGRPQNVRLQKIATIVEEIVAEYASHFIIPSVAQVKKDLTERIAPSSPTPDADQIPLLDYFNQFIEERRNDPSFAANTVKGYVTAKNKIAEFQRDEKRVLLLSDVDRKLGSSIKSYLYLRGFAINYIAKIMNVVKTVLTQADDDGLIEGWQKKSKGWNVQEEVSFKIYLSLEEIRALYKLKLHSNPRLERVRDIFVAECLTGLRFGDLSKVRRENLSKGKSGWQLTLNTEKKKRDIIAPAHPYLVEIINKYQGALPRIPTIQKYNDYLKELGRMAEFTEEVSYKKGQKELRNPKWMLISSHTARRSFITNALKMKMPEHQVMKIVGIKKRETLQRHYNRMSLEENADLAAQNPLYSPED